MSILTSARQKSNGTRFDSARRRPLHTFGVGVAPDPDVFERFPSESDSAAHAMGDSFGRARIDLSKVDFRGWGDEELSYFMSAYRAAVAEMDLEVEDFA